jgi:hypothetical protein
MGKAAVAIELTGEEERELRDLAGRRRTAQGLAPSSSDCFAGSGGFGEARRFVPRWMLIRTRSESGGADMPSAGSMDFWTSRARGAARDR